MPTRSALSDPERWRGLAIYSLIAVVASLVIGNSPYQISVTIFTICALLSWIFSGKTTVKAGPFVYLIVSLFLINALSLTQSQFPSESWHGLFKVFRSLLFCVCIVHTVRSESDLKKIFYAMLIMAAVVGLDALMQGSTGFELFRHRKMTPYIDNVISRLTGPFHHANDFSAYLSFVVLIYGALVADGFKLFSKKVYGLILLGFLLLFYCLIGTLARGAWVAVGIAFLALLITRRSKVLLTLVAVVFVWTLFFSPKLIRERGQTLWQAHNNTVTERQELWGESIKMIRKGPWMGLGVNTYARNEPLFKAADSKIDKQYAHNGYLQIAAETGLPGLAIFLIFLGYVWFMALGTHLASQKPFLKSAGIALLFGIFSFLMHAVTDTDLQSMLLVNTLWLAIGLVWASKSLQDGRDEEQLS